MKCCPWSLRLVRDDRPAAAWIDNDDCRGDDHGVGNEHDEANVVNLFTLVRDDYINTGTGGYDNLGALELVDNDNDQAWPDVDR